MNFSSHQGNKQKSESKNNKNITYFMKEGYRIYRSKILSHLQRHQQLLEYCFKKRLHEDQ